MEAEEEGEFGNGRQGVGGASAWLLSGAVALAPYAFGRSFQPWNGRSPGSASIQT